MHQIKLTKQTKIETDHQFNYLPTCTTHTFITTAFSWSSFNLHIKSVQIRTKKKKQNSKMTPCSCNACSTSCSSGCDGCKCASCGVCIYLSTPTYTLFSFFFPFFYLLKKARRCQSADPILGIALRQDTLRTISSPAGCEKEMI